jgi:hypothetical protein
MHRNIQYWDMKHFMFVGIFLILVVVQVSGSGHPPYLPDSDAFRPVYSTNLTGTVSSGHPMRIHAEIRDSETGFIKVYGWGENGTNWNLKGDVGTDPYIVQNLYSLNETEYPKVLILKNLTNEYLVLNPGLYPLIFESNESSGHAQVMVVYVYHDQIDMGVIHNQSYSVWETKIPDGLERVIFITESVSGTDLNLYVQKGSTIPASFSEFTYNSSSNCTTCWDYSVENYLAEIMAVENPEPGPYLMVTKAEGGDDFYYSYWMGIEKRETGGK